MVISLDRYRRTRSVGLAIPFGERVAIARKDQGLTQDQLSERIGYTQPAMSRLETGQLEFTPMVAASTALALNKKSILTNYCCECPVCSAYNQLDTKKPRPA